MAAPDVDVDDLELTRLIAACAERNAQALRQLYDRTAPQLLACMVRILKRRALAEEALQDVFVSIWQRASLEDPHHAGEELGRGSIVELPERLRVARGACRDQACELEIVRVHIRSGNRLSSRGVLWCVGRHVPLYVLWSAADAAPAGRDYAGPNR